MARVAYKVTGRLTRIAGTFGTAWRAEENAHNGMTFGPLYQDICPCTKGQQGHTLTIDEVITGVEDPMSKNILPAVDAPTGDPVRHCLRGRAHDP